MQLLFKLDGNMKTLDYSTTAQEIDNLKTGDRVCFKHNSKTGGVYSVVKETENRHLITCISDKGLFFQVVFSSVN